jgi:acetylglutamate kinase
VDGLLRDLSTPNSTISQAGEREMESMMGSPIKGGMILKIDAGLVAQIKA